MLLEGRLRYEKLRGESGCKKGGGWQGSVRRVGYGGAWYCQGSGLAAALLAVGGAVFLAARVGFAGSGGGVVERG